MNAPTEHDEIQHMAKRYSIAAERIERWRAEYGIKTKKRIRPPGMLSIGDIVQSHGISAKTLRLWRREGLRSSPGKGRLVLIAEADLLAWLQKKYPHR
jgi:hypothetical protein